MLREYKGKTADILGITFVNFQIFVTYRKIVVKLGKVRK